MEITKLFVKCSVLLFENTDTGQYLVDTRSTTSASFRGFDIVLVFDNPMTNKIKSFYIPWNNGKESLNNWEM